jgi:hypothetical protein
MKGRRFAGAFLAALFVSTGIAYAENVNIYARGGLKPWGVHAGGASKCHESSQGFHCSLGHSESVLLGFQIGYTLNPKSQTMEYKQCYVSVNRAGSIFSPRWDVSFVSGTLGLYCSVHKTGENDFEIFGPK